MTTINPTIHFWIGLAIFIVQGIAAGTIHLTNIVPDSSLPYVTAWAGLLSTIGTGYLTVALGLQSKDGK